MSDTLSHVAEDHADADTAFRHWTFDTPGPVRIGSDDHRRMFCRMLLDTHHPYKPAVIDWPPLAPDALARLTSLPIWDMAVQTEGRASVRVRTYAASIREPLLAEALALDAAEEARHKVVLSKLVQAYGIALAPEPDYIEPRDAEWAWMLTGYSECIDSFFAFGLFRAARESGYFPEPLVETFEPVIQEEARHILFFVNWVTWYRRNLPWWRRPWHALRVAAIWIALVRERLAIARGIDADGGVHDSNFLAANRGTLNATLTPKALLDMCLEENERRMSGYDARLVRPSVMPAVARFALRFLKR
ncbi:p-aminobenzoate N-oxygenase AurF [Paraburkholderia kururiensis]|uniref:ferritin-like domain-containing protein n=1 Tax=Paraburkholderia kururiensis TaxID=984307 RepID=UPI000F889A63|nr:ferritin-like domain-containing protein [Paraburkholderia kururiensis]